MEIIYRYKHKCEATGRVTNCSKAECDKCNKPKSQYWVRMPEGYLKPLTTILATLLMLMAVGCAVIDAGPRADKKNNANTSNTTFVYQYNNAGQPVAGARVRDNVKIMVQVKDPATGTYYDRQMDAGGWLLVKPESPLEAVKTPQK